MGSPCSDSGAQGLTLDGVASLCLIRRAETFTQSTSSTSSPSPLPSVFPSIDCCIGLLSGRCHYLRDFSFTSSLFSWVCGVRIVGSAWFRGFGHLGAALPQLLVLGSRKAAHTPTSAAPIYPWHDRSWPFRRDAHSFTSSSLGQTRLWAWVPRRHGSNAGESGSAAWNWPRQIADNARS